MQRIHLGLQYRITVLLVCMLLSNIGFMEGWIQRLKPGTPTSLISCQTVNLMDSLPVNQDSMIIVKGKRLATANTCCTDLFFSEYIEGSGNNQALGIYNPGDLAVDLSNYAVFRFDDGATMATDTFYPQGLIAPNEEWVIANMLGDAMITASADTLDDIISYDGNDALLLINTWVGDTLDVIGMIGENPGTSWSLPVGTTQDTTLIRNMDIIEGTSNWNTSRTQWHALKVDSFDQLGGHDFSGCSIHPQFAFLLKPGKIKLADQSSGRVLQRTWDLGDGFNAADSLLIHEYEQPGAYTMCLQLLNECDTVSLCITLEILPDVFGLCCPDTLSVSGDTIDPGRYTASHSIYMDGITMEDIQLAAGQQVKLLPGAEIKMGACMEITIEPCEVRMN